MDGMITGFSFETGNFKTKSKADFLIEIGL